MSAVRFYFFSRKPMTRSIIFLVIKFLGVVWMGARFIHNPTVCLWAGIGFAVWFLAMSKQKEKKNLILFPIER